MNQIEAELLEVLQHLDTDQQQQLLAMARQMATPPKAYSALELMKLPPAERQQLIEQAFTLAADEDFETFEAYSEENFDDDL